MSSALAGLTAIAVARPVSPPGKKQQLGCGPIEFHAYPEIGPPRIDRVGAKPMQRTARATHMNRLFRAVMAALPFSSAAPWRAGGVPSPAVPALHEGILRERERLPERTLRNHTETGP